MLNVCSRAGLQLVTVRLTVKTVCLLYFVISWRRGGNGERSMAVTGCKCLPASLWLCPLGTAYTRYACQWIVSGMGTIWYVSSLVSCVYLCVLLLLNDNITITRVLFNNYLLGTMKGVVLSLFY